MNGLSASSLLSNDYYLYINLELFSTERSLQTNLSATMARYVLSVLGFIAAFISVIKTDDSGNLCPKYVPKSYGDEPIGRCNVYNRVDYNEFREPKMIMKYLCDPDCKCCGVDSKLLYVTPPTAKRLLLEPYETIHRKYQCVQKYTYVKVSINNTQVIETIPSDCWCVKAAKDCNT